MRSSSSTAVSLYPQSAGFLFLALVPLVTLIPVTPVPAWLAQDLILRWAALLFFIFSAFNFFSRSQFKPVLELDFPDAILSILTGWILLSASVSQQTFDSFYGFKSFLAIVFFWFSLRMVWRFGSGLYSWFEKVFWNTAVVAAVWVFVSTAGRWVWPSFFNTIIPNQGWFPNANIAAGFLAMALIFGALKFLRGEKLPLLQLAVVLLGWGFTWSRGAFIAMAVTGGLYLLTHMRGIEKKLLRWKAAQWMIFCGTGLLIILAAVPTIYRLFLAYDMDPRSYFRIDIWASAFKMTAARPVWGFGPGTFGDVYPIYRPGFLWNTMTSVAHNEYLQVAAECGLPALVLTLLFLWGTLRNLKSRFLSFPSFEKIHFAAQAAECAFYLVVFESLHNLVDFTFHEWSHRLVLLGFVTYGLSGKKTTEDLKVSVGLSRRALILGAGALLFFSLWTLGVGSFRDYLARIYSFKSIAPLKQGNLDGGEAYANKSLGFRSNYTDPWNSLGAIEYARAGFSKTAVEREKHFSLAKSDFSKAIQLSPYSSTPQENEIANMVKRGRLEEALDLEKNLIEKIPEAPNYYLDLSRILMRLGRAPAALAAVQKALDIDDYYLPAYVMKAQVLEALGKKREALKVYEEVQTLMEKLNMTDPTGQIQSRAQKLRSEL